MSKLFFMNNGDFDVRAMMTMGVSAKSDDAIGFFGTGFKYAVAIILRLGGSIKISTLSGVYEFTARTETIRGQEFQIVYMNDQQAGFTTHLGVNWEPWQAYRELYCNAMDEGGKTLTKVDLNYDTIVEVNCTSLKDAHKNQKHYFLNSKPLHAHGECEIHSGPSSFIYYRGIAVAEMKRAAAFTYNILRPITLTEDRSVKYQFEIDWAIRRALQSMTKPAMLRKAISCGNDSFEGNLGFDHAEPTSDAFVATARKLLDSDQGITESTRLLLREIDQKLGNWPEFKMTPVQEKMLGKAKRFLSQMDVDVDRFPIKTVYGLGDHVMGRALDGEIYISEVAFNMGTKQLAGTLLEEWVHNKFGCQDFDRPHQNYLYDKIMSLGESMQGEPV